MHKDELIKILHEGSSSEIGKFDKIILVISTGVLVLSINLTFTQNIYFNHLGLLFSSWFLFILTIIIQAVGYLLSAHQVSILLKNGLKTTKETTLYSKLINYANVGSLISLILGIILISYFASTNISFLNKARWENLNKSNKICIDSKKYN